MTMNTFQIPEIFKLLEELEVPEEKREIIDKIVSHIQQRVCSHGWYDVVENRYKCSGCGLIMPGKPRSK